METIIISTKNHETYSSISNFFIDYYMTDANGEFVKVYLYLVRIMNSGRAVTVGDIADHFNLLEKDICRAIKYWIGQDVLRMDYNQEGSLVGITLLPLEPKRSNMEPDNIALFTGKQKQEKDDKNISLARVKLEKVKDMEVLDSKPVVVQEKTIPDKIPYAPKVILEKKTNDEAFSQIVYMLETYFMRPLSNADLQSLNYIYDELEYSPELLEYLVEFCVTADKKSLRYMEKTAIDWYERGIRSVKEAKESAVDYSSIYVAVLKQLGIPRKTPTSIETAYINSWHNDYAFDRTLVLEACKRAITKNPQSANFAYVNGILENWHKNNIKRLSDLEELDKRWQENKKVKKQANGVTNNQFNNFTQTKMDDELDILDRLFSDEVNSN